MFRFEYIYIDADTAEILNIDKKILKNDYEEKSRETIKRWGIPDTKITVIIRVKKSTQQKKLKIS